MTLNKILIIDDDEEMCEEIAEFLIDAGYDVSMVFNGKKGEKLIEKYDYNILLLDLKIPGLSGLDILKNIKEKNKKLKILILTGRPLLKKLLKENGDDEDNEEDTLLNLADGIINKPFNAITLLNKIKELTSPISKTIIT